MCMKVLEFLSLHEAQNQVKREQTKARRVNMHDLQLLVHLYEVQKPCSLTDFQRHCKADLPTITFRMKKLEKKGFITKKDSLEDRREVLCSLTTKGKEVVQEQLELMSDFIEKPKPLYMCKANRLAKYVDAMGSFEIDAKKILLIYLYVNHFGKMTIAQASRNLNMLQPTLAIASKQLWESGLLEKERSSGSHEREVHVYLTTKGKKEAKELIKKIEKIPVKKPRTK